MKHGRLICEVAEFSNPKRQRGRTLQDAMNCCFVKHPPSLTLYEVAIFDSREATKAFSLGR
jgi:hypothetical protein